MARRCMRIVVTISYGQVAVMCDRASPLANGGSQAGPTHCRNLARIAWHRTSHQHLLTFTGPRLWPLAAYYATNPPSLLRQPGQHERPDPRLVLRASTLLRGITPCASRQLITAVGRRVYVRTVRESSVQRYVYQQGTADMDGLRYAIVSIEIPGTHGHSRRSAHATRTRFTLRRTADAHSSCKTKILICCCSPTRLAPPEIHCPEVVVSSGGSSLSQHGRAWCSTTRVTGTRRSFSQRMRAVRTTLSR